MKKILHFALIVFLFISTAFAKKIKLLFADDKPSFRIGGDVIPFRIEVTEKAKLPEKFFIGLFIGRSLYPKLVTQTREFTPNSFFNNTMEGIIKIPEKTRQAFYRLKMFEPGKRMRKEYARTNSFFLLQIGIPPFIMPPDHIVKNVTLTHTEDKKVHLKLYTRLSHVWFTMGYKVVIRDGITKKRLQTFRKRFARVGNLKFPVSLEFEIKTKKEAESLYVEVYRSRIMRTSILVYRSARLFMRKEETPRYDDHPSGIATLSRVASEKLKDVMEEHNNKVKRQESKKKGVNFDLP